MPNYPGAFSQAQGLRGSQAGPSARDFVGDQVRGFDPWPLMSWMLNRKGPRKEPTGGLPGIPGPPQDPNALERMLAEKAQLRSQFMAPPTKRVQGPGIIMGLSPDTLKMSGAQRQAFLPQNAQANNVGSPLTPPGISFGEQAPPDPAGQMLQRKFQIMQQYPDIARRMGITGEQRRQR